MRLRTSLAVAAVASVGLTQPSSAVVRPKGAEAPIVSADRGPRMARTVTYSRGGKLDQVGLTGWSAIWDHDTDVPLRMWGPGQLVSGSVADAAIAEAAARQFLAQHIATLAPGATVADFELVSNELGPHGVRSVGFAQRASGIRVIGGAVGFAFKADRLVMVNSTALPHVSVVAPAMRLPSTVVANKAAQWLADAGEQVRVRTTSTFAPTERVILPVVRPRIGATPSITYRVAEQVAVEATAGAGRWDVWVDAVDAAPIARKSTIHYATGKVMFDAADRYPAGPRGGKPAAFANLAVDGTAVTTALDGSITWASNVAGNVTLHVAGPYVAITNKAGSPITEDITLAPNGTITWSHPAEEVADAQISAFVFANTAKQFTKTRINPNLAWLNQTLAVNVNENQTCNAYSTGDDIHFFKKGTQCENTGRIADVVYHEFGHSLHAHSIIDGVGAFDGALSEGMSDVLAALITRDHGMGRGFFFTADPLRDLDNSKKWPDDVGEDHDTGEIIGGAMWHLGVALEAKLGQAAGYDKTIEIYYGILQRAADIPSSYAEALLADDNDGDLTNGTPNQCEINAAFGQHGLADPTLTLGLENPIRDNYTVSITTKPAAASACPGPEVMGAKVEWKPRGGTGGEVALAGAGTTYTGTIPTQPDGTVVQYRVLVTLTDGSQIAYPKNDADPYYEFYVGAVTPLWCTDFENGFGEWTHGATVASRDEWEVGAPMGLGGDPKAAHGGNNVMGIDLSTDGVYRSQATLFAESPDIDLQGNQYVRLQYYRWLGVEDGFFDKAKIVANGTPVWNNYASATEMAATVSHIDREWRFQDVDLKAQAATGKIKLRFELTADQGFELAGWNVDDLCVVAATGPAVTCGNGAVDDGETCDDGNRTDGDGCNANCQDESTGGGDDSGCCSVGGGPEGALALSVLTLGILLRRRRR